VDVERIQARIGTVVSELDLELQLVLGHRQIAN
jgi:hypothetical protein